MRQVGGGIDGPVGRVILGPAGLRVEGWAHAGGVPVAGVELLLGEVLLGDAAIGLDRPDVARALDDPRASASGFGLVLARGEVPLGHRLPLRAVVRLADGVREELDPVEVWFRTETAGRIDTPAPGALVEPASFEVSGWAHCPVLPVSRVEVFLDGRSLGCAGPARPRDDVARTLGDPGAALSGFELPTTDVDAPAGPATLRARVTLLDGTVDELPPVGVTVLPAVTTGPGSAGGDDGDDDEDEEGEEEESAGHRVRPAGPPGSCVAPARHRGGGPVRVLWAARSLDRGGSQLRMAELVAHLGRRGGFTATVLSPADGPLRHELEASGATVHMVSPVPLDDLGDYDRAVAALAHRVEGSDVVFGATVTSFPLVDAAGRLGVPTVLRIGESAPLRTVLGWMGDRVDPRVVRRARRVLDGATVLLSNSHAAADAYRSDGVGAHVTVLATGVDVAGADRYRAGADGAAVRRELGIGPDERLMVCAATLWKVKGQTLLVSALAQVARDHPDLTCALVGDADPDYGAAVRAAADRYGLAGRVRTVPFAEDLRPWWVAADLAVCPSESEALPASVLEAMAFSLPVLACRVGDVPRLVEPGPAGWLVDPCDLASMVAGLGAVASAAPDELARRGSVGHRLVATSHDRGVVLDRTADLLRDVAHGTVPAWAAP